MRFKTIFHNQNKKHWKYTIIPCRDEFKIAQLLLIMFLNNHMDLGTSIKDTKHDEHFHSNFDFYSQNKHKVLAILWLFWNMILKL
jgi:hypothetical protein